MAKKPVDPSETEAKNVELELKKLELKRQQRDLAKPWWQHVSVSAPFATIIVAAIGFVGIWQTGYFDRRKAELEQSVKELTKVRDDLQTGLRKNAAQFINSFNSLRFAGGDENQDVRSTVCTNEFGWMNNAILANNANTV